jgi:O-Antigen ligase
MDLNINKENIFLFPWRTAILWTIIIVPGIFSGDIFSTCLVVISFLCLTVSNWKLKISYLKFITPLLAILCIGLIQIFGHQAWHTLRDIIYALTPIGVIFIGYFYANHPKNLSVILKTFILIGLIFSLIHLLQFIINPSLLFEKVDELRSNTFKPGGGLVILALIIGVFQYRLGFENLFPRYIPRSIGLLLLLLSFIFSFSRIGLVIAITLFLSLAGVFNRINWKSILSIGLMASGLLYLILSTPANESGTFKSKISKTFTEIAVSDYQNAADINMKWRGYETFRALLSFSKEGFIGKILGSGFGSVVDLGLTIQLGTSYLSEIPIFHNGYAYLLVKTGLIGLLCYIIFYFKLLKYALSFTHAENPEHLPLSRLLLGCTLSMMLSMYVVGGIAEIHDTEFLFLSGFIVRRLEIT